LALSSEYSLISRLSLTPDPFWPEWILCLRRGSRGDETGRVSPAVCLPIPSRPCCPWEQGLRHARPAPDGRTRGYHGPGILAKRRCAVARQSHLPRRILADRPYCASNRTDGSDRR
jgi:hypothetical protein